MNWKNKRMLNENRDLIGSLIAIAAMVADGIGIILVYYKAGIPALILIAISFALLVASIKIGG